MKATRVSTSDERPRRAQEAFADRDDESLAFRSTMLLHEDRIRSRGIGYDGPRRNVLVFHGIGGIGKTRITKALQGWVGPGDWPSHWGNTPALDRPLVTVRIDLRGSGGFEADRVLLRMRSAVSEAGVRFDAFDLGLAIFWKLARPNEEFPEIRSSSGRLVGEQIQESLAEVLQHEVGLEHFGTAGAIIRALRSGYAVTKRKRSQSRADDCPYLEDVVANMRSEPELTRDDAIHLAPLLHWDLHQAGVGGRPQLVVFIDTYEVAQGEGSSDDESIRYLAHYLPEVLFVVSGRNRLRWHEPNHGGDRERTGPRHWPGLTPGATEEPRQHLVGTLSPEDAQSFLEGFVDDDGLRLLPPETLERIVDAAGGLPLFLDLAVDLGIDHRQEGRSITQESFAATHEGVVRVVVRDLDETNRRLLRVGSLLANWDVELLRGSAGVPGGRIRSRFLERAFIVRSDESPLPYRVHDVIRTAVLGEQVSMEEWDADDWAKAGLEILAKLRSRIEEPTDPTEEKTLIRVALEVCARLGVEAEWLRVATVRFRSLSELARVLPLPEDAWSDSYGSQLIDVLRCYLLRGEERRAAVKAVAQRRDLHPTIEVQAWRHYAYRCRGLGHNEEALGVFRDLVERTDIDRDLHQHQAALTLITLGRLVEAEEAAQETSEHRAMRARASLDQWHGRLLQAADGYRRRADALREAGDDRVAAHNERMDAFWRGMIDPTSAQLASDARDQAEDTADPTAVISAISAQMATTAGDGIEVHRLFGEQADLVVAAGRTEVVGRRLFVLGFHYAVVGDTGRLEEVATRLGSGVVAKVLYPQVIQYWLADLKGEAEVGEAGIQWAEGPEDVRRRWVSVVHRRRDWLAEQRAIGLGQDASG